MFSCKLRCQPKLVPSLSVDETQHRTAMTWLAARHAVATPRYY